jgi:biotin carboxyl carrier protein
MIFDATVDGLTMRVEVRGGDGKYRVTVDGRPRDIDARETGRHFLSLLVDGRSREAGIEKAPGGYTVVLEDDVVQVDLQDASRSASAPVRKVSGPARVTAPMPGRIVRVLVVPGEDVVAGQGLIVVEAMKMENELKAPRAGRVQGVPAREGQPVDTGALLVVLE